MTKLKKGDPVELVEPLVISWQVGVGSVDIELPIGTTGTVYDDPPYLLPYLNDDGEFATGIQIRFDPLDTSIPVTIYQALEWHLVKKIKKDSQQSKWSPFMLEEVDCWVRNKQGVVISQRLPRHSKPPECRMCGEYALEESVDGFMCLRCGWVDVN